jgi:hypothetical protein
MATMLVLIATMSTLGQMMMDSRIIDFQLPMTAFTADTALYRFAESLKDQEKVYLLVDVG